MLLHSIGSPFRHLIAKMKHDPVLKDCKIWIKVKINK